MIILGIESTADETAICLLKNGTEILDAKIASSLELHKKTKGIVPEISARAHLESIFPMLIDMQKTFDLKLVDKFAVAVGPGLHGSLIVGVEVAKFLSYCYHKPLVPVNHLQAHLFANFITENKPELPAIGLVVSGGHTDLVIIDNSLNIKLLGSTRDDAAGEAFDKVARILLDVDYPGGPEIDKVFFENRDKYNKKIVARPMLHSKDYEFSFSGLKTSVNQMLKTYDKIEIAVDFQRSVVEVLLKKTLRAYKQFGAKSVVVGGGVSANGLLREEFLNKFKNSVYFPPKGLSLDNAVNIASAAYYLPSRVDLEKIKTISGLTVEEKFRY
jgi:N6-L-threonylcarbamoyladenine synthase